MKNIIKSTLCIAMAAVMASCSNQKDEVLPAGGSARFSVAADDGIELVTKASSVWDYTSQVAPSAFSIEVKNAQGTVYSGLLSSWDEAKPLEEGNYTVKAWYGSAEEEGFDKPYFSGDQNFTVLPDTTTPVQVPVALGNSIVKVQCTEYFKKYFPEYSFKIRTGAGKDIAISQQETRGVFMEAYQFTFSGEVKSQNGKTSTFSKTITTMEPKTCYTIKVDASQIGGNTIQITFDDTTAEVNLGDKELND